MGELTPDAAALIRSGRTALRPDASAHARVLESLGRRLGDGAILDGPTDAPAAGGVSTARLFSRWGKLLGGISVLAVAGVVVAPHVWTASGAPVRVAPAALPALPAEPVASTAIALPAGDEGVSDLPRVEHAGSAPRLRARSAAAPASDSLAEEVRLLSRAERQLSDGLGEDALRTLGEHERRFPKGALAEERMAARVEALCAVGRHAEAKAELTRLARAYPRSPHLDGARRFCGVDLGAAP